MINYKDITGAVAELINERELAINIGSDVGVILGMKFTVFEKERIIRDPVTNAVLGHIQNEKVKVKVILVHPKFSIARTYETYQTRAGVQDILSTYSRAMRDNLARFAIVSQEETRVRTLKASDKPPGFEHINELESYVKVGDPVKFLEMPENVPTPANESVTEAGNVKKN